MMAAIRASAVGAKVILVEKNPLPGKKLLLSGKGRCNLTNACDLEIFLARFSQNGQFLRDAFKKFFNRQLIDFFENRGLKLKVERQLRVFPVTNKSASIVEVLQKELLKNGVEILYNNCLKDIILKENRVFGVLLEGGKSIAVDSVILATGGLSYSNTGSSGEGLKLAKNLGHQITATRAGLVPLEIEKDIPRRLEGLTLKNIRIKFGDGHKQIISEIGELLFTQSGISGPLVLSLSGRVIDWLGEGKNIFVEIDFKPALSKEQLDARLMREFKAAPKKNIKNTLKNLLPLKLVGIFLELSAINPENKNAHITQKERLRLVDLLKAFRLNIKGALPIEEAMITRGGVSLGDINPRTMESRIIHKLYFAGEMMDVDADTGGFNLQAAFSTGYLAGESAAL